MIPETEILSALSSRAEEFTLTVFPESRVDPEKNCLWVNDTLQVYTAGLRSGRWLDTDGNSGDLLDLYAEAAGVDRGAALERCADILGLAGTSVEPETPPYIADEEPVPIPPEERPAPPRREKPRDRRRREPEVNEHRALPADIEAEKGLIGSLLQDPAGVLALCEDRNVLPGYFSVPSYATIYQVIVASKDEPMDFIVLTQKLRELGSLDEVGGPAAVTELFTFVPTSAMAERYIEILRACFVRRRVIIECQQRVDAAFNGGDDPVAMVEVLRESLRPLAQSSHSRDLSEVTEATFNELMAFNPKEDSDCLLGNRWLSRGGSALWIGQSGIGKSSLTMQAAMMWSYGSGLFGIAPKKRLRSLIIQAENDTGDMAEMAQGVIHAMLSGENDPDARAELIETYNRDIIFVRDVVHTGKDFCRVLSKLIRKHKPDLVWVDPLLSYAGGDIAKQEVASAFLRNQLNPVLLDTGVCAMIAHHTGKPPTDSKAKSHWTEFDFSYSGLGSSELTNWARAINILRPLGEGLFELRLAKRGKRAGAKTLSGVYTDVIHLRHAETGIFWDQVDAPASDDRDRDAAGKFEREYAQDDILSVMQEKDPEYVWRAGELQKAVQRKLGMSKASFYRQWAVLSISGKLVHHENKGFSIE